MTYFKTSDRTVSDVVERIAEKAKLAGFGVLHQYDFQQTLASKGFPISRDCRVMELCNPAQAAQVLGTDMQLALALPCRIAIYEHDDRTVVGMIDPTDLMDLVSANPSVREVANTVAPAMRMAIDAAV